MWEVAQDIQLRAATDEALATAARFDPPARYRDEHELWVASLDASRRHLQDSQEALERRDLVAMMVAFMRSELELVARLPDWSEEYCRAVFPKAIPPEADVLGQGPDAVCRRDELSPGGDYGRQLRMWCCAPNWRWVAGSAFPVCPRSPRSSG